MSEWRSFGVQFIYTNACITDTCSNRWAYVYLIPSVNNWWKPTISIEINGLLFNVSLITYPRKVPQNNQNPNFFLKWYALWSYLPWRHSCFAFCTLTIYFSLFQVSTLHWFFSWSADAGKWLLCICLLILKVSRN